MSLQLSDELQRRIARQVESGCFLSAEEVLEAGLAVLEQQETFGGFEPGELDKFLAEGERSIVQSGPVPAAQVFAAVRDRRAPSRRPAT